jgi:hypothetical protein
MNSLFRLRTSTVLDNQQRGVVCLTFFSLLFLVGVGAPSFVSHDPVGLDNFNDKVQVIALDDIFTFIAKVLVGAVKAELDAYHLINSQYFSTVDAFDLATPWFLGNDDTLTKAVDYLTITDDSASLTFGSCGDISSALDFIPPAIV